MYSSSGATMYADAVSESHLEDTCQTCFGRLPFPAQSQYINCSAGQGGCSSIHYNMQRALAKRAASADSSSPQEQVSSSYKQMGAAVAFLLVVLPSCAGARDSRRAPAALTSLANSSLRPNLPARVDYCCSGPASCFRSVGVALSSPHSSR
jgi:hypothetical protein